ncbi:MAG: Gfo/Idh/MocA family oxidoreductase [Pseudomonadota bacterium]
MTDKKGVALIGTGMVAGTYVDALQNASDRFELTHVMASHLGSAEAFVAKFRGAVTGTAKAVATIDEITEAGHVDFAIIITPPNARLEIVKALAKAGKPMLMEKPVERTLAAATQIVEMCERADVPLGIMFQHRARPSARAMRALIAERKPGALRAIEISVPWWREQSYYDEPGRGTYERDGGGVLISQAIHTMDLALTFTGKVQSVQAMASTSAFHTMEAEDFVSAGIVFEDGAVGSMFASTATYPGRTEEIILHYEHVSVRLQSNLIEIHCQKDGSVETIGESAASGAGADPMAFTSDWHRRMIENFADALDGNTELISPGREALEVHKLIAALERSNKEGRRVEMSEIE